MTEDILLSFIMPCYNVSEFVQSGIETIIKECDKAKFSSYEIIAVNDGSTDRTKQVLDKIKERKKDYRLSVIDQNNAGVSAARNAGFRHAKGHWIWFVDADDNIAADCMCAISDKIRIGGGNDETDGFIFGFSILDRNNVGKCYPIFPAGKEDVDEIPVDAEVIDDLYIRNIAGYSQKNIERLYKGLAISEHPIFLLGTVWHYLFRKDVILKNNLRFDERVTLNEDGLFVIDYLSCITNAKICRILCYDYRLNSTGGLFGTLDNPQKMSLNKIAIAEGRERVRENILYRSGKDIREYYMASVALSIMEIAVKSTSRRFDRELMGLYLSYCNSKVAKYAVKEICTQGAPLKYKIPFTLLKLGLYRTVFLMVWLIQKCGYQITGKNSLFK